MAGLRGPGAINGTFGFGRDGSGATIFGANPIVGTVSLGGPTFVDGNLTIGNGGILQLQAFPLFVKGKLIFSGTGKIQGANGSDGANAVGGTPGAFGAGAGANYCGGGQDGGVGGSNAPSPGGSPGIISNAYGGAGGNGGSGVVSAGGGGGLPFEIGNNGYVDVYSGHLGYLIGASGAIKMLGGAGGGGGGSTGATSDGGGGGGGAGVMIVCAEEIVGATDGCIFCKGGKGGNGDNGGAGGGGGGGGTLILAYAGKNAVTFTPNGCVPGGALGTSINGGGFNGNNGGAGKIFEFAL
jgi:hypothetical protein